MPLMTPLIFNLGPTELIIILVIVLLLFGGSRLAGLGKSSGRALKEFKEETKGLRDDAKTTPDQAGGAHQVTPPPPVGNGQTPVAPTYPQQPYQQAPQPFQQPYTQAPGNVNDPSVSDVRKDV